MYNYQRAICYSGYRDNQGPNLKIYPSYSEVKEDLFILDKKYDIIRMYDPYQHAKTVLECIARESLHLKVMLGMDLIAEYNNTECPWHQQNYTIEQLEDNARHNDDALKELIKLANQYPNIIQFISAGNEARPFWGENLVTEDRIVYFIEELKKNCLQPVTYCEGFDVWCDKIEKIYEAVDFASVHIYPMWSKVAIDDALEYTIKNFALVKSKLHKPIVITEAGWATSTTSDQMHKPSANIIAQQKYVTGLIDWATTADVLVFIFEAFDEPWKGGNEPLEAEKHWGLYDVLRNKKWR